MLIKVCWINAECVPHKCSVDQKDSHTDPWIKEMDNQIKEGGETFEAQIICMLIFLENGEGKVPQKLDEHFDY